MILLVPMLLALAVVPLAGGRYSALKRAQVTAPGLFVVLFVLQGVARGRFLTELNVGTWAVVVWACCGVLSAVLLWVNRRLPGATLALAGLASNMLVVLLNGSMPVAAPAKAVAMKGTAFYTAIDARAIAPVLADVVPMPGGYLLSVGDLLMALAAFVSIVSISLGAAGQYCEWPSDASICMRRRLGVVSRSESVPLTPQAE